MSAPANVTGDRLDRVAVGHWVHVGPMVLSDATPTDGWRKVIGVLNNGAVVSLTFADETAYNGVPNELVRIGW